MECPTKLARSIDSKTCAYTVLHAATPWLVHNIGLVDSLASSHYEYETLIGTGL